MEGQVFITQGDITRLHADAVAVTNGIAFKKSSENFAFLQQRAGHDLATLRRLAGQDSDATWAQWVPFPGGNKPRGMVFVPNPSQQSPGGMWASSYMVARAVDAAANGLRKSAPEGSTPARYLIALIGFRMGEGGDKRDRARSAWEQIRAAYDALDRHPDIDIAFVLDDRAKYEIFVDARRRYLSETERPRPPFPRAELAELIDALKSGECVAFVGAGFSLNSGLGSYGQLIQQMADAVELGGSVGKDAEQYFDIAQMYRDHFGSSAVQTLIKQLYGDAANAAPSLAHYLLLSLPIRFVMTTNYDRLLEQTLEHLARHPLRVVNAEQVAQTGLRDGTYVVKMHGDAHDGHLVLSRSDYDGFFHDRPEMASLLEGLLLNQSFLFVGYSLRDPNFRQVYGKISQMLKSARRPAYVLSFEKTRPALRRHLREHQQLHLVEVSEKDGNEGAWDADAPRRMLYLLDRLGEEVIEGHRLFLTPDASPPAPDSGHPSSLDPVRAELDRVGHALLSAIAGPLTPDEIRTASRVLSFLADMGWQPRSAGRGGREPLPLHRAYLRLADLLDPKDAASRREKRQLLTSALRYADSIVTARSIRKHLQAFAAPAPPDVLTDEEKIA